MSSWVTLDWRLVMVTIVPWRGEMLTISSNATGAGLATLSG